MKNSEIMEEEPKIIMRYEEFEELQNKFFRKKKFTSAKKRRPQGGFYWHLFWYLVVNLFNYSLLTSDEFIWHFAINSTAFSGELDCFFIFLGVYGSNLLFGESMGNSMSHS